MIWSSISLGLRPIQSVKTITWFSDRSGIASTGVLMTAWTPQITTPRVSQDDHEPVANREFNDFFDHGFSFASLSVQLGQFLQHFVGIPLRLADAPLQHRKTVWPRRVIFTGTPIEPNGAPVIGQMPLRNRQLPVGLGQLLDVLEVFGRRCGNRHVVVSVLAVVRTPAAGNRRGLVPVALVPAAGTLACGPPLAPK